VQISVAAHKPANKSATAALNRALTAMAHELPGGSAPPSKRITSGPATGRIAGGSNGASSGSKADEKPGADKRIASPPNDLRCIEAA
jgi:hypothetical protein